jgi:endonuclease/exonuclease/phosphatase family metal-dependent hydrolase
MKKIGGFLSLVSVAFALIFLLFVRFTFAQTPPVSIKVMTYNFRYFENDNKGKIAAYLRDNNIGIVGFQELQYNPADETMSQMSNALANVGYPMTGVDTLYSPQPERLAIFYSSAFEAVGQPQSYDIGPETGDRRKLLRIKLRYKSNGQEFEVYNQHPVSGASTESCNQNMKSLSFINSVNNPNTIFMGDFNLRLFQIPAQTSCNDVFNAQFYISCRTGETSVHPASDCLDNTTNNIDFVLVDKRSDYMIADSYFEQHYFSRGKESKYDSDHYPMIAIISAKNINLSPTPTKTPTPTVGTNSTPTPTLSSQPTPTPTFPISQATPTPTSTNQQTCDQMKKQGNFNCAGGVDESDFTSWKEAFNSTSSTLLYFEYWRRISF